MAGLRFSGSIPRSRIAFSSSFALTPSPLSFFSPPFSPARACSVASTICFASTSKKSPQGRRILAAPETVRAKRHQLARNPLSKTLRQNLHVIRCRNKRARAGRALQCLRNVWHLRLLRRVQHIPACAIVRLAIELLVTSHTPNVHRDAIVLFENFLR